MQARQMQLLTIALFAERYPFISEAGLRYLIYRSKPRVSRGKLLPPNGLAPAFHRLGRRVYVDPCHLLDLIAQSDQQAGVGAGKAGAGQ